MEKKINQEMIFALRMLMLKYNLAPIEVLGILTAMEKEKPCVK